MVENQGMLKPGRRSPVARAFWASPDDWPSDGPGTIFLARAVDQLGFARFKEHWIGVGEAGAPAPFPGRDDWGLTARDLFRAAKLIRDRARALWIKNTPASAHLIFGEEEHSPNTSLTDEEAQRIAQSEFTDEQWDRAKLLADSAEFGGPGRAEQWGNVIDELGGALLLGDIKGELQDVQGGASWPMDPSWWNIKDRRSRFRTCQLNEADYPLGQRKVDDFGADIAGSNKLCDIFVDAQSFQDFLSTELVVAARELPRHLSPYILAMLHVAKVLDVAPDNMVSPDLIKPELEAYWSAKGLDPDDLSPDRQRLMATLIRGPDQPRGPGRKNFARKTSR